MNKPQHLYRRAVHRAEAPVRKLSVRHGALALAGAGLATVTALTSASAVGTQTHAKAATAPSSSAIFYGVDGKIPPAGANTLAFHNYGQLNNHVPVGRMLSMGTSGQSFAAVASAKPGSATYTNIVRWATTIKSRGGLVFYNFAHEPEAHNHPLGGPAEFIAAYRHVVDIFRAQGVTNVRYVWQMTGYGFAVKPTDARYAPNWYPGNAYVDDVAIDTDNWDGCGPDSHGGKWIGLDALSSRALAFAKANGRHFILGEYASQSGPMRSRWLSDAAAWMVANRSVVDAAFYFNVPDKNNGKGCHVYLGTQDSGDLATLIGLSHNSAFSK